MTCLEKKRKSTVETDGEILGLMYLPLLLLLIAARAVAGIIQVHLVPLLPRQLVHLVIVSSRRRCIEYNTGRAASKDYLLIIVVLLVILENW